MISGCERDASDDSASIRASARAAEGAEGGEDVVVARADDAEDDEPERAFADVPHLYEYVVHGNLPRADVRNDAREGDGGDEAATLHAAFSDGWRMKRGGLLEWRISSSRRRVVGVARDRRLAKIALATGFVEAVQETDDAQGDTRD